MQAHIIELEDWLLTCQMWTGGVGPECVLLVICETLEKVTDDKESAAPDHPIPRHDRSDAKWLHGVTTNSNS